MRYCPLCGETTDAERCPTDGIPTVVRVKRAPVGLPEGTVVAGRYRIGRVIGRGGFSAVYGAEHLATAQKVAVKILNAGESDAESEEMIRRFFQEARTTCQLTHPNTVRVFDFGQMDDGSLFLVMELLRGRSLAELVQDLGRVGRVVGQEEAARVGIAVLRSLGEAHAKGLVHRDLKPQNIFLHDIEGEKPVVKVLDFGVVKRSDSQMTDTGRTIGTPTHMAPEQAMSSNVDGRADLYSLGVCLWECVTGELPFWADSPVGIMMKHVIEPLPSLRECTRVPLADAFVEVVQRALAKKPEGRHADAVEMRRALERVRASVQADEVTPQRMPVVQVPAIELPTLPLGVRPGDELVVQAPVIEMPAATVAEQEGTRVAQAAQSDSPLAEDERAAIRRKVRDTWSGRAPPRLEPGRRRSAAEGEAQPEAPAPVAETPRASVPMRIAAAREDDTPWQAPWSVPVSGFGPGGFGGGGLRPRSTFGGSQLPGDLAALLRGASGPGLSAAGPAAALEAMRRMLAGGAAPSMPAQFGRPASSGLTAAWIASDGRLVAMGNAKGEVLIVEADLRDDGVVALADAACVVVGEHSDAVGCVAALPGSRLVASGSVDGSCAIHDPATQGVRVEVRHPGPVNAVALSTDGRLLATGCEDAVLRTIDPETGAVRRELRGHKAPVSAVALTSAAGVLASGDERGHVRTWDPEGGASRHLLAGHEGAIAAIAIVRDGSRLASAGWDGTVRLWDLSTGRELRCFDAHSDIACAVAISADGAFIATGGDDRVASIWEAATGRPIARRDDFGSGVKSVAFVATRADEALTVLCASWDGSLRRMSA